MAYEATSSRTNSTSATVKGPPSTTFTWVINNFTKLNTKKLFSDVFVAGGYKWRLLVYPNGRNADYLSVYLQAAGSANLSFGWSINAQLTFTLVNQILKKYSYKKCDKCRFDAGHIDQGFTYFMPLTELNDSVKGFLSKDRVVIEIDVSVDRPWRDSKKDVDSERIPMVLTPPESSRSTFDQSSSTLLEKSKNLLTELSILKITRKSSLLLPISPKALQEHRKALKGYLALSLEAIDKANAFPDIEKITLLLLQDSTCSLLERTVLKYLVTRLAAFKELVPATKSRMENVRAQIRYLSGKKANIRERLYQGQEHLNSLEVQFSKILQEEMELEPRLLLLLLTTQKDELFVRKILVSLELEKMNEQVSKDLEDWRDISEVIEVAAKNWIEEREELAQANLSWQLLNQNLELCEKSV